MIRGMCKITLISKFWKKIKKNNYHSFIEILVNNNCAIILGGFSSFSRSGYRIRSWRISPYLGLSYCASFKNEPTTVAVAGPDAVFCVSQSTECIWLQSVPCPIFFFNLYQVNCINFWFIVLGRPAQSSNPKIITQ